VRGTMPVPIGRFDRVLAALDGSPTAERALAAAAQLRGDGRCTLLQVIAPRMAYPSHYIPDMDEQKAAVRAYLDCIGGRIRREWKEVSTRVVDSQDVAETILSQAGDVGANLLVVGTHARTPVMRAMVGSVADKVIRGADIAVLVAPPAEAQEGRSG